MISNLRKILEVAEGRAIISCYSSNIDRIQQIIDVSVELGRAVCVAGRRMLGNIEVAVETGHLTLPEGVCLIEPQELPNYDTDRVTIIATGSQGEPLSVLRLISSGEQKHIQLQDDDLVIISAGIVPGNESQVYRTINQLCRQGVRVLVDGPQVLHVSGHGNEEELKMMLLLTKPKYVIPMHGEFRHLVRYQHIAESMGYDNVFLLHSGDVLALSEDRAQLIDKVTAGRVMIDGLDLGDIGNAILRDRKRLSEDGIIVAIVAVDTSNGEIVSDTEIVTRGFVYEAESGDLLDEIRDLIVRTVNDQTLEVRRDKEALQTRLSNALGRRVREATARRPIVVPMVVSVSSSWDDECEVSEASE